MSEAAAASQLRKLQQCADQPSGVVSAVLLLAVLGCMHVSRTSVATIETMGCCGLQLPQVLDAIQLSHATFNKIRQNLWWAFGYNLVGIPLAAGALLPSMGIALTPSISGHYTPPSNLFVKEPGHLIILDVALATTIYQVQDKMHHQHWKRC